MEEIKKIEVQGQQYGVADMLMRSVMGGNAQVIEWSHTHNMNDYKEAGTYRIKGERTGNPMTDNLPIMNSGSGHTIEGILYVFDSSLTNGSGKVDDCTITQFLMLSNRVGGQEGDMYMRSGFGVNKDSLTWKPWEKYQTNMEVGVVSDDATHDATTLAPINSNGLKTFVDNGIYSGVYLTEEALKGDATKAQTFVMVVINNYAIADANKTITQIKFAVTNAGEYSMERRRRGFDGKWSGWINEYNDLSARIDEKAPKVGYAPDLKVNFAKELVGRGEATPQVIGKIRPTGEISIGDGNATIEKIKGNSVVWNQMVNGAITFANMSTQDNITYVTTTTMVSGNIYYSLGAAKDSHKYLCTGRIVNSHGIEPTTGGIPLGTIFSLADATRMYLSPFGKISVNVTTEDWVRIEEPIHFYDLTQMFGAGNEPTTIEEFEACRPLGVTDEYNEGEIISYDGANALQSVGFNAWDEEWEVGTISTVTGDDISSVEQIRSSRIRLIPNEEYYCNYAKSVGAIWMLFWDNKGKLVEPPSGMANAGYATNIKNVKFTIPSDCSYARFYITKEYGSVYTNDICIHLVHSGYRNGEYKPYEADTLQLPDVKSIKDKDSNLLFPYGLLSAGSAHDEITATKAIKRIGVVDMGTLNWNVFTTYECWQARMPSNARINGLLYGNAKCAKYIAVIQSDFTIAKKDKTLSGNNSAYLFIRDLSYTDATTFKQAMQGVLLYYELAEPIEVDLAEPLNLTYEAWDFGTEELHTEAKTTPLNADISYQFNAVDRIRENTTKASGLEARIAQLEAMLTQMAQVNESNEA